MYLIFLFVRVFPFFAFGACVPLVQLARFYRNRNSKIQWLFWLFALVSFAAGAAWVWGRGDLHSDEWVKARLMIDAAPQTHSE